LGEIDHEFIPEPENGVQQQGRYYSQQDIARIKVVPPDDRSPEINGDEYQNQSVAGHHDPEIEGLYYKYQVPEQECQNYAAEYDDMYTLF
jgi:hypothetical protein